MGGARTLIDLKLASPIGKNIELAIGERYFSYYWGPYGRAVHYRSRVGGPVTIHFDQEQE